MLTVSRDTSLAVEKRSIRLQQLAAIQKKMKNCPTNYVSMEHNFVMEVRPYSSGVGLYNNRLPVGKFRRERPKSRYRDARHHAAKVMAVWLILILN